jgi:hypothetical protein
VLGGVVALADDRVQVIDADDVQVLVVAEDVALDADHRAQPLLVEHVPGERDAARGAPLADLAVVGVGVELGQRLVEVEAHPL